MWEMSNIPARSRTARCSSTMDVNTSGKRHPANSAILAPADACILSSGETFTVRPSSIGLPK